MDALYNHFDYGYESSNFKGKLSEWLDNLHQLAYFLVPLRFLSNIGEYKLRTDKEDIERCKTAAEQAGMSLNKYIIQAIKEKSPMIRGGSDAAPCFQLAQSAHQEIIN